GRGSSRLGAPGIWPADGGRRRGPGTNTLRLLPPGAGCLPGAAGGRLCADTAPPPTTAVRPWGRAAPGRPPAPGGPPQPVRPFPPRPPVCRGNTTTTRLPRWPDRPPGPGGAAPSLLRAVLARLAPTPA